MKYRLTEKDDYNSYLLHIKPRKVYAVLGVILILIFLLSSLMPLMPLEKKPDIGFSMLPLACLVFVLSTVFLFPLYRIKKARKQSKGKRGEVELVLQEDTFVFSDELSNLAIPYINIYKVKSNKKYLLIYFNEYAFITLPKMNDELVNAAIIIEERHKNTIEESGQNEKKR